MKKLSQTIVSRVVFLLKSGESSREISKLLNISQKSVINIKKYKNVEVPPPKLGRPRLLTNADARRMERKLRSCASKTPKQVARDIEIPVSEWTARRALRRIGLVAKEKPKKPALSKKNIKARLLFAKKHKNWSVDEWKKVMFSDEMKVNRIGTDGRSFYWSKEGEQLQLHPVRQTMKHGGGSIMAWGCFSWNAIGPLVRIQGIMTKEKYLDIIQSNIPSYIEEVGLDGPETTFQQDGDPKHTAKIVKEWPGNQQFSTMQWPAQSPDLNPIENLWSIVKRQLGQYDHPPSNIDVLWDRIEHEWGQISIEVLHNLVESMPRRCAEVIKKKRLWTKY